MDLGGTWRLIPDPCDVGLREAWHTRTPPGAARDIQVPSAWQSVLRDDETDIAWYTRQVTLPALTAGTRRFLAFDSVATRIRAWANGEPLGAHEGDWIPFRFEIPPSLSGPIDLVLRVDRARPGPTRWIDNAPVCGGDITKGFHDVLSLQHAGIWQPVRLRTTGALTPIPDGIGIVADPDTGDVRISIDLESPTPPGRVRIELLDPRGEPAAQEEVAVYAGASCVSAALRVTRPDPWSPDSPARYTARITLLAELGPPDVHEVPFGFRTVKTGGPGDRRILLNGRPIFLSGVLDWGHEPRTLAPAPPPDVVRERFAALKARGFNTVCICMWYPPRHFYDIADELGVLIWQEHPVWKAPMDDGLVPEYRRRYLAFMRRDRNHPSIVVVSGSCEHERFHPDLAQWWWTTARAMMPDRLLQVQTAFLEWSANELSDLFDEHTYESSGRWVAYLNDVDAECDARAAKSGRGKPFALGESIMYVEWPTTEELATREQPQTWATPRGLHALAAAEDAIRARHGEEALRAFRAGARRFALRGRKFQTEAFRANPDHAGVVHNHLVDVAICRCGFIDGHSGAFRSTPTESRPWLAETVLLLRTPDHLTAFHAGRSIGARIGLANFGPRAFHGAVEVDITTDGAMPRTTTLELDAPVGDVSWADFAIDIPRVDHPTEFHVQARAPGLAENGWTLWALPSPRALGPAVMVADAEPPTPCELAPEFEERRYSSGWGLSRMTFEARYQLPRELTAGLAVISRGNHPPDACRVALAHRLTIPVQSWLESGGRVLLLASRLRGSCPTAHTSLWGQNPFIAPLGPLAGAANLCVLDALDHDLSRRYIRTIPTSRMRIDDQVEPIIRSFYTHDIGETLRIDDPLFATRVGKGILIASSLDHHEPAGKWLLHELLAWLASDHAIHDVRAELDPAVVRWWNAVV